jgi:hypothetical protein
MKNIIKASAFLVIVVGASVSAHAACSKNDQGTPCGGFGVSKPGCVCVGQGSGSKYGYNSNPLTKK